MQNERKSDELSSLAYPGGKGSWFWALFGSTGGGSPLGALVVPVSAVPFAAVVVVVVVWVGVVGPDDIPGGGGAGLLLPPGAATEGLAPLLLFVMAMVLTAVVAAATPAELRDRASEEPAIVQRGEKVSPSLSQ